MFGPKRACVVDLDGVHYAHSHKMIEQNGDLDSLKGDKLLITDFQEEFIARTATVEAPARYAELMVARQLQESGDFNEPVTVISHLKRSRGKNTTDIFYTAVPVRAFNQTLDRIDEHEDCVLLYPIYGFMHGVLRRIKPKEPAAIVFQHSRYADVLVGTNKRVYYAQRSVAFDSSQEQVEFLWENVKNEINGVERDHGITVGQVYFINWLDSGPLPAWADDIERRFLTLEEEALTVNGQMHRLNFCKAAARITVPSASPTKERWFYKARRAAPVFNLLFFLVLVILGAGWFLLRGQAAALEDDVRRIKADMDRIQLSVPKAAAGQDHRLALAFLKDLEYSRTAPGFKEVVNDISGAITSSMTLHVFKLDYGAHEISLEMYGEINDAFDRAHQGYRGLLDGLRNKGYKVRDSRFTTEVTKSGFLLKLTRAIP